MVIIPATTKQRYLGGMGALNVLSYKGTGDWHMLANFFYSTKISRDPLFRVKVVSLIQIIY